MCPSAAECAVRLEETRLTFAESLRRFRPGQGSTKALRDLLDCCRREQIPVVLIIPPESTLFRSWYTPEGLAAVDHLLDDLRRTYGVRILDARHWVADKDFGDGHHVLPAGAEVFTTRLLGELEKVSGPNGTCAHNL